MTTLPAGWKLVPIEPTDEMETAAEDDYEQRAETFPDWKAKYRAMLAAAPTPPASAQDDAKDKRQVAAVVVPDVIRLMAQRIAADKFEHCTSDPIFTVQRRHVIGGFDLDWCENVGWFCDGDLIEGEQAAELEAEYEASSKVPDDHTRTGIAEEWEHFATYVTMEAAEEFVARKGERYRVYVDSGCRNHEWKALRAFLLEIAKDPTAAPAAGDARDRLVNKLASMAYQYAVTLDQSTRNADSDQLEEIARRITGKLKDAIRTALSASQQQEG